MNHHFFGLLCSFSCIACNDTTSGNQFLAQNGQSESAPFVAQIEAGKGETLVQAASKIMRVSLVVSKVISKGLPSSKL